ncbi:MAG TPA: DUF4123 domain-containing protein, partial [Thermomicrobiales bacterium]|nr:DUF4123 domain-containing protein [Thermomicrobiales bacterium]
SDETTGPQAADETMHEPRREAPPPPNVAPGAGSSLRSATVVFPTSGVAFSGQPPEAPELVSSTLRFVPPAAPGLGAVWPAAPERLFAVVDGAVALAVVDQAKRFGLRTESLIVGLRSPYLAAVAPYLIELSAESGFLELWQEYLNKNPGVLLTSTESFDALLEHARRLFVARDAADKESFFRFYDPKVLKSWLADAPPSQLAEFFSRIVSVIAGFDGGGRLTRLSLSNERIESREIAVG